MGLLGILAAMPQEVEKLKQNVEGQEEHSRGIWIFTTGTIAGNPVVFAAAEIGMVFASAAVTLMINEFKATRVVFTGVAGGLKAGQSIGDLIIGTDVVNYEMDARTFKPPWDADYTYQLGEIPIKKWRFYDADPQMLELAMQAPVPAGVVRTKGRLASGSVFLDHAAKTAMKESHWDLLGEPLACEMENAGVAQICKAFNVPYLSLRALSDLVEGDANEDFGKFCQEAADNVFPIVQYLAKNLV